MRWGTGQSRQRFECERHKSRPESRMKPDTNGWPQLAGSRPKGEVPTPTPGVALSGAPAYMDSPAGSDAHTYRRRWWGRKVLRQRRVVGRRWDIRVDSIGNVG